MLLVWAKLAIFNDVETGDEAKLQTFNAALLVMSSSKNRVLTKNLPVQLGHAAQE